jgi:hypothetical protein
VSPLRLVTVLLAALTAGACDSGSAPADAAPADAAPADAPHAVDAAGDAPAPTDAPPGDRIVTGDASNAACTFNADCPDWERCECDETTGCFCRIGPRGTGACGVDPCVDGDDCVTSLCVEGNGGVYYCSCPCTDNGSCGPQLPNCTDIAFLGRVCVR